jgi:small-conductance mechanosensitive channel
MDFLENIYFGNSVKSWLIVLGIIVLASGIIKVLKGPVLKKLKQWSAKTNNTFDDFIVMVIEKSFIPILYFAAVFGAIHYLNFSTRTGQVIRVAGLFIIAFFILRLITSAIRYLIFNFLSKQENSETKQKQARGLISILNGVVWFIGFVFLISNLGYNVTTIITGLGVGGIAVALAAQTVLGDFFSYFVIFFDRPFEVGDFLIVGSEVGAVEYIGIKTTRIRAISGEQIIVANKDLTDSRVHNFKRMLRRRVVFKIGVTYQTTPEQLRKIPEIIKNIISSKENTTFDRSHFSGLGDFKLDFESVYYIEGPDYNQYMDIQQAIYLEIFEAFAKEKIEFAYPTQTLFAANTFVEQQNKKTDDSENETFEKANDSFADKS